MGLCRPVHPGGWESLRAAGSLTPLFRLFWRSEITKKVKFLLHVSSLVLLQLFIRLLALPLLLQGGQREDRASMRHEGHGRRRGGGGRGGGWRGRSLLRHSFCSSCFGGAPTAAPRAAGRRGDCFRPESSSKRRSLSPGIIPRLPPQQLALSSAPLSPQVSVPRGRGSGWGRGRLVLLGFPAGVSEAGQRGTKPHATASRALYGLLQL